MSTSDLSRLRKLYADSLAEELNLPDARGISNFLRQIEKSSRLARGTGNRNHMRVAVYPDGRIRNYVEVTTYDDLNLFMSSIVDKAERKIATALFELWYHDLYRKTEGGEYLEDISVYAGQLRISDKARICQYCGCIFENDISSKRPARFCPSTDSACNRAYHGWLRDVKNSKTDARRAESLKKQYERLQKHLRKALKSVF